MVGSAFSRLQSAAEAIAFRRWSFSFSGVSARNALTGYSLGTTHIIDSSHSGIRTRTRRVSRWKDGQMVLRWAALAFLQTETSFRKIQGYRNLWML